ncbi:FAR-17a/AIG1-like protein [Infundibulicybe gibba]|nr:FAR-17a/AIG1-like protein [Infundibulicybe gibba]
MEPTLSTHYRRSNIRIWIPRLETATIHNWVQSQYGGHFQFLTVQGLAIAWATMTVGLASDVLPSVKALRSLKRFFQMMALPLAVVISSIYWTLLLLFPHLILQQDLPQSTPSASSNVPEPFRLPLSVDLALHAAPGLILLVDFVCFDTKYTTREVNRKAPVVTSLFSLWYVWWVERCGRLNGICKCVHTFMLRELMKSQVPYPFLTDNPLEIRLAIYAGASLFAWASLWTVNKMRS